MGRLTFTGIALLVSLAVQACDPFTIDGRDPAPTSESTATPGPQTAPGRAEISFAFRFESGSCYTDVLDTFQGTFTKDLINAEPETIPFTLPPEELQAVKDKMEEIGFFEYPAVFAIPTPASGVMTIRTPASRYRIVVTSGGTTKTLEWVDEIVEPTSPEAENLRSLFTTIEEMITSSVGFKMLGERSGGCA